MKSCYARCRFFFENVLKRNWHIFKIGRAKAEQRMPTVLTIEEVHNILVHVTSARTENKSNVTNCNLLSMLLPVAAC
jgi:hypothetical protein